MQFYFKIFYLARKDFFPKFLDLKIIVQYNTPYLLRSRKFQNMIEMCQICQTYFYMHSSFQICQICGLLHRKMPPGNPVLMTETERDENF